MMVSKTKLSLWEFIPLMALLTSLIALSIDSVLPALEIIGHDLHVNNLKDTQLIIITLFAGMSIGQFFYGPLADNIGRKPSIAIGIFIFLIGSLCSIYANNLSIMLMGRFLQGLGVSGPRIVTMTIIRDCFSGREMARIMSIMMTVFILIPIIAPSFGFWIMTISHWHYIFIDIALISIALLVWFYLRQEETLNPKYKQALNIKQVIENTLKVVSHRQTVVYSIISGLIFGSFLAYISGAQHIFQNIYQTGDNFPYYFAVLASALGIASLINSAIVKKLGMRKISFFAISAIALINIVSSAYALNLTNSLSLLQTMFVLSLTFFLFGLSFGNINALAMEPLGELAGIGAGVVGSISTLLSIITAYLIGVFLNSDIVILLIGYVFSALISLIIIHFHHRFEKEILNY